MEEINLTEPKQKEIDDLFGESEVVEENQIISYMAKKNIPYSQGILKRGERLRKTRLMSPLDNEKLYQALVKAGLPVKFSGNKFVPQYHSEVVYVGDESDEELL